MNSTASASSRKRKHNKISEAGAQNVTKRNKLVPSGDDRKPPKDLPQAKVISLAIEVLSNR